MSLLERPPYFRFHLGPLPPVISGIAGQLIGEIGGGAEAFVAFHALDSALTGSIAALEPEWRALYGRLDCEPAVSFEWTQALARTPREGSTWRFAMRPRP